MDGGEIEGGRGEAALTGAQLPLFRFRDGGVRRHPAAVERDRRRQGGGDRPAAGSAPWPFGAGILFFPISYVIGDVLTEVYGYARARRCIWAGFAALLFMAFMAWVVVALPPAPDWPGQAAYEQVFGQVPRIVLASMVAFWAGEFVNTYVLARMKVWTEGRHLWTPDDRLDRGRAGDRQPDLLSARFLRRVRDWPIEHAGRCWSPNGR